jgi:hypothetical protein
VSAPIDEQAELAEISAAIAQLEPAPFGSAEEILATLHHDVGKYLTRVARNVPPGAPCPPALARMLLDDLYATHRGARASARFGQLAELLPQSVRALAVARAAERALARIDEAEPAVRSLAPEALARALQDAREVERCVALLLRGARAAVRRGGLFA